MKKLSNKTILFAGILALASLLFAGCKKNDPPVDVPQAPTIATVTPIEGPVGTTVTITGTNFSVTPSGNIVKFDAATASVTSATTTQLVVQVPASLLPGRVSISVSVNGKTVTATQQFTVKPTVIPVKTTYWVRYTGTNYEIVKGALNANGTQTITKLYEAATDVTIASMALHPSTKNLYWMEQTLDLNTFATVSVILKGDTTGAAAVTIIGADKGLTLANNLVVNGQNNKIYLTNTDEVTGEGQVYSSEIDGSGFTRLYSTASFKALTGIATDAATDALYFIESYDGGGAGGIVSVVYKGNINGSGTPAKLYDKTNFPEAGAPQYIFVGIAINGTDIYLAERSATSLGISYILKGSTSTSGPLAKVFESAPGAAANPLELVMGLTIDKQHSYLYWINQGAQTDGSKGTIYRSAITAGSAPQLLLKDIQVANAASASLELGK